MLIKLWATAYYSHLVQEQFQSNECVHQFIEGVKFN